MSFQQYLAYPHPNLVTHDAMLHVRTMIADILPIEDGTEPLL